ncbi:MAG: hypothetical protein C0617_11060 [Desulfuromonas sp.]|uniref:hypothetical protein n=1 Tax=Desulfuromonas sp. TaxID=892 RepID=UPI000CA83E55|nr:hypothetical protein [Desulfuromonas sp.]PLX83665.1 MAG: hypothetical protein C0617_11060 [Desulfuromonas sp.]
MSSEDVKDRDDGSDSESVMSDEVEDDFNPFLNARPLEIHRTSKAPEVDSAIGALCEQHGKKTSKFKKHLKVLVCDLYHNYKGRKDRYLRVGLGKDEGAFKLIRRYNRFEIGYRLLKDSIDYLLSCDYVEYKKGYRRKGFVNGFQTRIRATEKLIRFLEEEHDVMEEMIYVFPDQELVVRKKKPVKKKITTKNRQGKRVRPIVKIKQLDPYTDNDNTKRWRNVLERYNDLIAKTYIDLDLAVYVPEKERKRPLYLDLSRKRTRRIFSNGNFISGGRFYGGWWQAAPSDVRPHMLIDGRCVVENDFSGMHVHILYAMVGKKLSDLGLLPYVVSKDNDPENKRPYYKKLFLTAINADGKRSCLSAIREDMRKNPADYPDGENDLSKLYDEIVAYHPLVSDFLKSGEGLKSQYVDSCIAYRVIKEMTDKRIPVLCIHDSFISTDRHADIVLDCMKRAYITELNLLLKRDGFTLRLTLEDAFTDETTIVQRGIPHTNRLIAALGTMKPLALSRGPSTIKTSRLKRMKPVHETLNRDDPMYLFSQIANIDPKQKERQLIWNQSNRCIATFNDTVEIDTRKILKEKNPES